MDQIDALLKSYEDEMVQTLRDLVRIPSVNGPAQPGMPFGPEPYRALCYAMDKAAAFGLEVENIDGYACHADLGQGGQTLGVLAHLDVVPEGTGWTVPPFEAVLQDGYLYGRGATDNKNSVVSCLYALRAIKEAGIPLKHKVRLIMGCNEEMGSSDMEYYAQKVGMPDYGFSPDGSFPLVYAEKGIHRVELRMEAKGESGLVSMEAGTAVNVVPNSCSCVLINKPGLAERLAKLAKAQEAPVTLDEAGQTLTLRVQGVSCHAASPAGGRNAASLAAVLLSQLDLGAANPVIKLLSACMPPDGWDGHAIGAKMSDEPSGPLTANLGLLRYADGKLTATLDIRQPVTIGFETVRKAIAQAVAPYGATAVSVSTSDPLYLPLTHPLIQTLLKVYRDITGRMEAPLSMGGGTYARSMNNAVAFGPGGMPGEKSGGAHEADEHLYLPELFTAARIYAHAIVALAGQAPA